MATDKDINHTWDSEKGYMESAKTMNESIDMLAAIIGLHEDENWKTFRRHPMLSERAKMQFLRDQMKSGLELILYDDPRLIPYYSQYHAKT